MSDGYAMDPMEQDGDEEPFRGGSTEMKDAFLAERQGGHVRNTPAQNAAWHTLHAAAQAKHAAPDAELVAWGRPFAAGAQRRDDLFAALVAARRELLGRQLYHSERLAIWLAVNTLWTEPRAATEAA